MSGRAEQWATEALSGALCKAALSKPGLLAKQVKLIRRSRNGGKQMNKNTMKILIKSKHAKIAEKKWDKGG